MASRAQSPPRVPRLSATLGMGCGLAVDVAVAIADAATARNLTLISLLAIGPLTACALTTWRRTAAVAVVAMGFAVALGVSHDAPDREHVVRWLLIAVVGVFAVFWAAQQQRREGVVRALRGRAELLLASAADGIYGIDPSGRVTFMNPAAVALLGFPAEEMIGRLQHELVHHSHADGRPYDVAQCPINEAASSGVTHHVAGEVFWRADGTPVPVEYSATPVEEEGVVTGAVVTFRDISERLAAERQERQIEHLAAEQHAQRQVFEELERTLRPALPRVPAAELGVCYQPAEQQAPTGGDLYDALLLPDGSLHLAVVDVMGHGVASTRDAIAVTHQLRALVLGDWPLVDCIARADELIVRSGADVTATVLLARYHPGTGEVQLAGGGHPPALVLGPGREPAYIDTEGRGIGFPEPGSDGVACARLGVGDTMLLYTDGLIERTRDIVAGLDRLATVAGALAGEPAGRLPQLLVDTITASGGHPDDTLALVLRRLS